jgi:hypothetical protein
LEVSGNPPGVSEKQTVNGSSSSVDLRHRGRGVVLVRGQSGGGKRKGGEKMGSMLADSEGLLEAVLAQRKHAAD